MAAFLGIRFHSWSLTINEHDSSLHGQIKINLRPNSTSEKRGPTLITPEQKSF